MEETAVNPNPAIKPYVPSAKAALSLVISPILNPLCRERWIHRMPIGPISNTLIGIYFNESGKIYPYLF